MLLLLVSTTLTTAEAEDFDFGAAPGQSLVLRRTDTHATAKQFFRRADECVEGWSEQCIEWHEECTEEGERTCKQTGKKCASGFSTFCQAADCNTSDAVCERQTRRCSGGWKRKCTRTSKQCSKFVPGIFDWLCDVWEYVCEETDWVCDLYEDVCEVYVDACNIWDNACTAPTKLCDVWEDVCLVSTEVTCTTWSTTCKATGEVCTVLKEVGTVLVDAVENFGQCLADSWKDVKDSVKGQCITPPGNISCYVRAGGSTVADGFVAGCPVPGLSFKVQLGSADANGDKDTALFSANIGNVELDVPLFKDMWTDSVLKNYLAFDASTDFSFTNDAKLTVSGTEFTLTVPGLQWGFDTSLTLMAETTQTPCSNEADCTLVLNKGRTTLLNKAFSAGPIPVVIQITAEVYVKAIPTFTGSARTDVKLYFADDVTILDTAQVTLHDPTNAVDELREMFDPNGIIEEIKSKIKFEVTGQLEADASLKLCFGVKLGFHVNGMGTTVDVPVCMTAELSLDAWAAVTPSTGGAAIDVYARVYLNKLEIPFVLDLPDISAAIDTACGVIKGPLSAANALTDLVTDCTTVGDCIEGLVDDICDGVSDAVDVLSLQTKPVSITVIGSEIDIWSVELLSLNTLTTSEDSSSTDTGYSYTVSDTYCPGEYTTSYTDITSVDACMSLCDADATCVHFQFYTVDPLPYGTTSCQLSTTCSLESGNQVELGADWVGYYIDWDKYAFGTPNTNECPEGYTFIDSVWDCKKASEWAAREEWHQHHVGHDFGTTKPRGCYLDETWSTYSGVDPLTGYLMTVNSDGIWYNDDSVGGAQYGTTPLCKLFTSPKGYTKGDAYCSSQYKDNFGVYGYEDTPDIEACAEQCNARDMCISFLYLPGEADPCRLSFSCTMDMATNTHATREAYYKDDVSSAPDSCGLEQHQDVYVGCQTVYLAERDRDEECNCAALDDCKTLPIWLNFWDATTQSEDTSLATSDMSSCNLYRGQGVWVTDCGVFITDSGWTHNADASCQTGDKLELIFDSWIAPINAYVPREQYGVSSINSIERTYEDRVAACNENDNCLSVLCLTAYDGACTMGDDTLMWIYGITTPYTTYLKHTIPYGYLAMEETNTEFPVALDTADVLGLNSEFTISAWVKRTGTEPEGKRCVQRDNKLPLWDTSYSSVDYPSYDTVTECHSLCLLLDTCYAFAWRREEEGNEWSKKCLTWTEEELDAEGMSSYSDWNANTNFIAGNCPSQDFSEEFSTMTVGDGTQSCSTAERISLKKIDEDGCKAACSADPECYIIYWQSTVDRGNNKDPLCHMYTSCNELRTPSGTGTHYKKQDKDFTIFGTDKASTNQGLHLILRNERYFMGFYYNDCHSLTFNTRNAWEHVAFTYTTSGSMKIYVNGELVQQCDNRANFQGTTTVNIGQWAGGRRWEGSIKDVRVWKEALTDGDVEALYHHSSQTNPYAPASYAWCSEEGKETQSWGSQTALYTLEDAKATCETLTNCKAITCHEEGYGMCDGERCCQMSNDDTLSDIAATTTYAVTSYYYC